MSNSKLILTVAVIASLSLPFHTIAKTKNYTEENYKPLIESINEVLSDRFVFPEVAPKYVSRLNQCIKEDCLSDKKNDEEAAKHITDLMQSIFPDRHLKVFAPGQREKSRKRRMEKRKGVGVPIADSNGIAEVKVLEDNIGYIKIDLFPGTPESIAATNEAMRKLKDTSAIVFDIRHHRGGSPQNITEISNFLFQEKTHMVTTRSPHRNGGKPTPHISEPNEFSSDFKDKPVYLLTSKRSGSAAEHFAMSMKATGRAILVGETTGGYGHWGGIAQLNDGFSMFIPMGRTYHPVSKLGWEEIGITPDIMVEPEESLEYTLKRIRALL